MYIWCQDNQSELKKSFLLLSQCARSKRNVKSLNGSYYTTTRLHFGLKIGKKVKKFKPFRQTPPLTSGHGTTSQVPLENFLKLKEIVARIRSDRHRRWIRWIDKTSVFPRFARALAETESENKLKFIEYRGHENYYIC